MHSDWSILVSASVVSTSPFIVSSICAPSVVAKIRYAVDFRAPGRVVNAGICLVREWMIAPAADTACDFDPIVSGCCADRLAVHFPRLWINLPGQRQIAFSGCRYAAQRSQAHLDMLQKNLSPVASTNQFGSSTQPIESAHGRSTSQNSSSASQPCRTAPEAVFHTGLQPQPAMLTAAAPTPSGSQTRLASLQLASSAAISMVPSSRRQMPPSCSTSQSLSPWFQSVGIDSSSSAYSKEKTLHRDHIGMPILTQSKRMTSWLAHRYH
eukprot:SAG31_NODE_194_length_20722_cov_19.854192_19_plen_267_part_00